MEVEETVPAAVNGNGRTGVYNMLEEARKSMEEIVAKMLFIKKEGKSKSELRELITQMSLHFINLRQINRTILLEEDRVKTETESAKAPVDFTTLQLHNLMYEKNHYLKAIKACKDFKSKHPDIDLVSEEEFFMTAPEEIKGNVVVNNNAHDLMLRRLNFELFQRKELCSLQEKLQKNKKNLMETIANRKKFLSTLPSYLKSLKKASLPVQQHLGIFHTKKLKQHHSAELLPPPLYVLYSQLLAQKEAFGENIELEIMGSIKDAHAFTKQQAEKDNVLSINTESSRLEDDVPDDEDDGQRRRKRPKKAPVNDSLGDTRAYQYHPLRIVLHVYDDEIPDVKPVKLITMRFEYLTKLNIVCVGIEGSNEDCEKSILCNLFPDDTGIDLPHLRAKVIAGDATTFDETKTSYPYKWAQHLSGIDFLPELSPFLTVKGVLSGETMKRTILSGLSVYRQQNRVHTVVQRIRSRKKAQLALEEQLHSLQEKNWPTLTYKSIPWALHTPLCTLQSWSAEESMSNPMSASLPLEQNEILDLNMELRKSPREELESIREDGELPSTFLTAKDFVNLNQPLKESSVERCHCSTSISKRTHENRAKIQSFGKQRENDMLLLDSGSDVDEPIDVGSEDEHVTNDSLEEKNWEAYAVREFLLVLSRKMEESGKMTRLEAKVRIGVEYPLRPPLFSLKLLTNFPGENSSDAMKSDCLSHQRESFECNELRAMEAEVNLHMVKMVPLDYENYILSHQVHCLAMLFDYHMDPNSTLSGTKSTSVIDIGLCTPENGKISARSTRGRDRRRMISWKNMECSLGYPC